jgi:transcription elongation regulator 1
MREVEEKIFKTREECVQFTEHDTPDGKKYYFNSKLNQSVWDKPKCLIEMAGMYIFFRLFKSTNLKLIKIELTAKLEELKKKKIERPIEQAKPAANKEKEVELTEEEKAKQKSKPISSTAVPGTPWCVVWTRDKRVFFYNPSEKVSLWERPQILVGRLDVDKMFKEPPPNAVTETNNSSANLKKKSNEQQSTANEPPQKKNK